MSDDPRSAQEPSDATLYSAAQPLNPTPSPPSSDAPSCGSCGAPLDAEDEAFCPACGTRQNDLASDAELAAETKPRPWFALVLVFWLVLMAFALYFLYAFAIGVGSA